MWFKKITLFAVLAFTVACQSAKPLKTVDYVDIERFMGDWYVIANIPTFLEKNAYNPVESYRLDDDGSIATTFSFNAGSLNGEKKVYKPRGFVVNTVTNAEWGMQFIWPIKADYRIVYLDEDYQHTVIGRNNLDYVWIMARQPKISAKMMDELTQLVSSLGYDSSLLELAPHQMPLGDN
ncbi:lipocalin family protein [Porticoccaceae bacterium]|nr:lipocalin family protein [Porticoccaceae bacterium]MDA9570016.1 lipocalin family protein [Porticoccaceae bacterium]